jgi:hypothetical protein
MANDGKNSERAERRDSKDNKVENKASNEALDEMRKKSESQKDQPQSTSDNTDLPKVELTDTKRTVPGKAEYDDSGNLTRYTDGSGKTFLRDGDHFTNPDNPVQPKGVDIAIDQATGTVKITDKQTGIVKSTTTDGTETTDYSAVGGGKTVSQTKDGSEYITIESTNRPMRSLIIDQTESGARVRQYTDSQGTTYSYNGSSNNDNEKGLNIPRYTAVDKNGNKLGDNFTVTADRTGNVVTRNEDKLETTDNQYARRELNNGTIVVSNKTKTGRVIEDNCGTRLTDGTPEASQALESKVVQEAPKNVDLKNDVEQAKNASADPMSAEKYYWFQKQVETGGPWDYKSANQKDGNSDNVTNSQYEDYGNWHYGYVGNAANISQNLLEQQAGAEQIKQGTNKPGDGSPSWGYGLNPFGGSGTYGDDPHDNEMIKKGVGDRIADNEKENANKSWWETFDSRWAVA